jgi:hypothetical protein
MRATFIAAGLLLGGLGPAAAANYPWCTTGAGHDFGARNCGFVSFEHCMQTARGNGQFCERNPALEPVPPTPSRTKRKSPSR